MSRKRVKICHVTSAHRRYDVRVFHKQCFSTAANGYDTILLVADDSPNEERGGVTILSTGLLPKNRLVRVWHAATAIHRRAVQIDADIYHLHDPELLGIALALKARGKIVIFDSHEDYHAQIRHKEYLPKPMRAFFAGVYYRLESFVCSRIDAVIFPCPKDGKNIFAKRSKRTVYVDNYPLLAEFPVDMEANESSRLDKTVVYVGSISRNRGITELVLATHKAGATLLLAGSFSPASLRSELELMPEYATVRYSGLLDHSDIAELLATARMGVSTLLNVGQYNKYDNLPTKVIEYMAVGLPVIVSNSPYNRKMIEATGCGLCVNPHNVDDITTAITELLDNPQRGLAMGEIGRDLVVRELSWTTQEKKLLQLYNELSFACTSHHK